MAARSLTGWCGLTLLGYAFASVRRTSGVLPAFSGFAVLVAAALLANVPRVALSAISLSVVAAAALLAADWLLQAHLARARPPASREALIVVAIFLGCISAGEILAFISSVSEAPLPNITSTSLATRMPIGLVLAVMSTAILAVRPLSIRLEASRLITAGKLARRDFEFVQSLGVHVWEARRRILVASYPALVAGMLCLAQSLDHVYTAEYVDSVLIDPAVIALAARRGSLQDTAVLAMVYTVCTAATAIAQLEPGAGRLIGLSLVVVLGAFISREP